MYILLLLISLCIFQFSSGKTFGGMLFADDFVGVSDSKESLQKLIDGI